MTGQPLPTALKLWRRHRATLVIAKLDRLARNVAFISNLMESGVEFVAVDKAQAIRFVVHILAAVAEREAEAISKRTKAAIAAAKARGTKYGGIPTPFFRLSQGFAPEPVDAPCGPLLRCSRRFPPGSEEAGLIPVIGLVISEDDTTDSHDAFRLVYGRAQPRLLRCT